MSFDEAVEELKYLEYCLEIGGVNPHYACARIDQIVFSFPQDQREKLKAAVFGIQAEQETAQV